MEEVLDFVALAEAKVRQGGGLDELPGAYAYALGGTPELTVYGELEGASALWRVVMTPTGALIDVLVSGGWLISKQVRY